MAPVVFTFRIQGLERHLYSYGLMVALSLLVSGTWFVGAVRQRRLDTGAAVVVTGSVVLLGFVGARALFVAVTGLQGGNPVSALLQGGIVFYGGLMAGAAGGALVAGRLGLPVLHLADLAVVPLCVGHAIGRVGCLLGGCCYGRPWSGPWAVVYHDPLVPMPDGVPRHPVPGYEALALILLALGAGLIPAQRARPGARLLSYALVYPGLRFGLELLRGDAIRGVFFGGMLSTSQFISLAVWTSTLGVLWRWTALRVR